MRARLRFGLGVAGIVLALDQASKWWIVDRLMDPPRTIEIVPFFNLVMAWNRGVSFGLFANDSKWGSWLLAGLALAITIALVVWLARAESRTQALALGMVVGGAIGNVIDRLRFGAVADFLDIHVAGWHWPAFNVADSGISVGVALLLFDALFGGRQSNIK